MGKIHRVCGEIGFVERFIGLWREIHRKEPSAVGRDPSGVADPSGLRDSWVLWRDPSEISIGLVERSIGFVERFIGFGARSIGSHLNFHA